MPPQPFTTSVGTSANPGSEPVKPAGAQAMKSLTYIPLRARNMFDCHERGIEQGRHRLHQLAACAVVVKQRDHVGIGTRKHRAHKLHVPRRHRRPVSRVLGRTVRIAVGGAPRALPRGGRDPFPRVWSAGVIAPLRRRTLVVRAVNQDVAGSVIA
jgi:hypothetical protein